MLFANSGNIKFKANASGASASSYDLFLNFGAYTGDGSYYEVSTATGSWSHSGATGQADPGAANGTVMIPPQEIALTGLSGTGNRPVYAAANGTLKTYNMSTTTSRVNFTTVSTGSSWVVPADVYSIRVLIIGAGAGSSYCNSNCGSGGAGGFVQGNISVNPGETLTIVVGAGGAGGGNNGSGGKGSAIKRGSTILAAAGGGGGGSYYSTGTWGFGGGRSYGTTIDGTTAASGNTNYAGGQNNIDYLQNAISLLGPFGQSGNNFNYTPQYVYFLTELDQNTVYGRGGRGSYGDAGGQGGVWVSY